MKLKAKHQIKKQLKSTKHLSNPIEVYYYEDYTNNSRNNKYLTINNHAKAITNIILNIVKNNPKLLKYVRDGSMTFQKFYEMYDIYGESNSVWDDYLKEESVSTALGTASGFGLSELFNMFKNIDLDSVQRGIGNLERVLGVVGEMGKKEDNTPKGEYKPRPIYKHFED